MNARHKTRQLSRRGFLAVGGLLGAGLALECAVAGAGEPARKTGPRPNIILLVTDDQRWDCLRCAGNEIIVTPNLDRLAQHGVLFVNNFCTSSICMTSRASILTGQYMRRHGIKTFRQPLSPAQLRQTYPLLLRRAGYRVGFIGKWGVGNVLPEKEFDYFKGFPGQGRYFHTIDGKQVHLTSIIAEQALEFLRREDDRPFCLSVSFKAPHVQDGDPRQFLYDPKFEQLYANVHIPVPKTARPEYFEQLPQFIKESEGRRRWRIRFSTPEKYQQSVKGYYRLITGVDDAVGQMLGALDEVGKLDNTVILFTSDNGFFLGEHGLAGKWLMYEESIRTPLIICDPRLPNSLRGRRRTEMTLNVDLAPTILELAGVPVPDAMQGKSLLPLLRDASNAWREEWFYEYEFSPERIPTCEGVRTKRWKYIRYTDFDPPYEELFDLQNDPGETENLIKSAQHKDILEYLRGRWAHYRTELQ